MNKHAIFHITDIPYTYAIDEKTLAVRLKAARGDLKSCEIYFKDRYDWENSFNVNTMELKKSDGLFDYYETSLKVEENRYRYYFRLEDKEGSVCYYNERGLHEELIKPYEQNCFQFPYLNTADIHKVPAWAKEGIVYQIFPDRFCNGDKNNDPEGTLPWGEEVSTTTMFGGDLQGIINKLDYLQELGINIVYLTPIFLASTNHKYNTCDYYQVDPSFGDVEKAKELVEKCHARGIRVLFDAVFNHSGSDFFAFKDVVEKGEKSKYKDWFYIKNYPVDTKKINYITFANNVDTMPKLNTHNPEVKEYLLKVGEYWIKEVGIDGWRLDVCDEVDHAFWKEFRKVVKAANPEALIIGEIMHESTSWMRGDQMDGFMNYPLRELLLDFFARGRIKGEKFKEELAYVSSLYTDEVNSCLFNLIGSHDTARFLTDSKEDINKLKLAAAFQYTYIGLPYIYYGDEIGMVGENDPFCRRCMIWDEDKQDKELLAFFKKLNALRKTEKVLIYGDYKDLGSKENILIYKRTLGNEEILVILNNNSDSLELSLESDLGKYVDLLNDSEISLAKVFKVNGNEIKILKKIK